MDDILILIKKYLYAAHPIIEQRLQETIIQQKVEIFYQDHYSFMKRCTSAWDLFQKINPEIWKEITTLTLVPYRNTSSLMSIELK
jgi:hypothetical protein